MKVFLGKVLFSFSCVATLADAAGTTSLLHPLGNAPDAGTFSFFVSPGATEKFNQLKKPLPVQRLIRLDGILTGRLMSADRKVQVDGTVIQYHQNAFQALDKDKHSVVVCIVFDASEKLLKSIFGGNYPALVNSAGHDHGAVRSFLQYPPDRLIPSGVRVCVTGDPFAYGLGDQLSEEEVPEVVPKKLGSTFDDL